MTETVPDYRSAMELRAADRYAARRYLWRNTSLKRIKNCGRAPRSSGQIMLSVRRGADGVIESAGYQGLQHCGSVWACPVCAAKISSQRSLMLSEALRRWHDPQLVGGRAVMLTLTVRHHRGQTLREVWDAVARAWGKVLAGTPWRRLAESYGVMTPEGKRKLHFVRVFEVTHGASGWHVYVHALVFLRGDLPADELASAPAVIRSVAWGVWDRAAQRIGLEPGTFAASECHLVEAGSNELGEYFAKAAYEITWSQAQTKRARGENLSPFEVLSLLTRHSGGEVMPEAESALEFERIWAEWEQGSNGRRQLGISHGFLRSLGMGADWLPTDEEIADQEIEGEPIWPIMNNVWESICKSGLELELLHIVTGARGTGEAARALMRRAAGAEGLAVFDALVESGAVPRRE